MLEARHTLSSPIPWRRQGIKYQNQECFFDISEQLSAVIDRYGLVKVILQLAIDLTFTCSTETVNW